MAIDHDVKEFDEKEIDSVDKVSLDSNGQPLDDAKMVKEVEAMEDRIQHDEASESEYRVQEAYEVALKVSALDFLAIRGRPNGAIGPVHPRRALAAVPHLPDVLPRPRFLRIRSVSS